MFSLLLILFRKTFTQIPFTIIFPLIIIPSGLNAQIESDSLITESWNFHFQNTVITQFHPSFHARYSGKNSLNDTSEKTTSITGTIFLGLKLWKGAECYFNPELSGGEGFSLTRGIAGFPNGEVYRVDNPRPKIYVARLIFKQYFSLSDSYHFTNDDFNQLRNKIPDSYIGVYFGKFSLMDYFDNNHYSHDPRTQFYNWALMGNGAWDYAANTRGYTNGIVIEWAKPSLAIRFASVMMPLKANGPEMDKDIIHSRSDVLEFEKKYSLGNQKGTFRFVSYLNEARMGNYNQAIIWGKARNTTPNADSVPVLGNRKFGLGINIEHAINKYTGLFFRASWNDGRNETWAFTEIDKAVSTGVALNGDLWKREDDYFGFAVLANGLSGDHKKYLEAGGYGFIIGDGKLNYSPECITEMYYSYKIKNCAFWISPDYQFIVNPGYNKERGPVHAFGIRIHAEI